MSTPDGGRLPADMKVFGQLPNNLTFHPENGEHSMVVTSPDPGNWFLLAYINKKEKTDYVQEVKLLRLSFRRNFLPYLGLLFNFTIPLLGLINSFKKRRKTLFRNCLGLNLKTRKELKLNHSVYT